MKAQEEREEAIQETINRFIEEVCNQMRQALDFDLHSNDEVRNYFGETPSPTYQVLLHYGGEDVWN